MLNRLAGPLADAGLNVLGSIVGGRAGPIGTTVGGAVLKELGVTTPEQAARMIEGDPESAAGRAKLEAERGPERAAVALAEQRTAELWQTGNRSTAVSPIGGGRAACTSISISGSRTPC